MPSNSTNFLQTLRKWALNGALVVASIWLTLAGTEAAAKFVYFHVLNQTGLSVAEFRRSLPAPYQGEPYATKAFIEEALVAPGGWLTPSNTRIVLPHNFAGQFITVQNNMRTTTNQPPSPTHTLYMFGGSTLFAGEVPDSATIPSALQRQLNAVTNGRWKVVNLGVTTINAAQQLERLKTTPLKKGDAVLFYDGVNDIAQGIFYGNPKGWIVDTNRAMAKASDGVNRNFAYRMNKHIHKKMPYTFAVAASGNPPLPPPSLTSPGILASATQATAQAYLTIHQQAAAVARSQGAVFIHALQPNLYTHGTLTGYEERISQNPVLILPGIPQAFQSGNTALQATVKTLQTHGIHSVDLSNALTPRPSNTEYFLDFCHVTGPANARIATALAQTLVPLLSR